MISSLATDDSPLAARANGDTQQTGFTLALRAHSLSVVVVHPTSTTMTTTSMSVRIPVVAAARHLSMAKSTAMSGASAARHLAKSAVLVAGGSPRASPVSFRRRRHGMTVIPRAGWNDFEWGSAKVVSNKPAAKEGGLHSIVVQVDADQAKGYTTPGQFIQMRTAEVRSIINRDTQNTRGRKGASSDGTGSAQGGGGVKVVGY